MGIRNTRGLTLVELAIGTALLVGGGGALLVGMHYAVIHADYLNEFQLAMNAVQSRLEEISAQDFDVLINPQASVNPYAGALNATGMCMGLNEDRNCNDVLNGPLPPNPAEDLNGNGVLDEPLAGARLNVRIVPMPPPDTGNPTVLTVHVSACWMTRQRRIGEDRLTATPCDGVLNGGEDTNGNGWLDSPAMASTRLADDD